MIYDPIDKYVVLFGGDNGNRILNDTWTYHAGRWTQVTTTPSPSARIGESFVWDAHDGYGLLFGGLYGKWPGCTVWFTGYGAIPICNDTWSFVGGRWSLISATSPYRTAPAHRFDGLAAYDPRTQSVLVDGGYGRFGNKSGLWSFQSGTWDRVHLRATSGNPFTNSGAPSNGLMTYDPMAGSIIELGPRYTTPVWTFSLVHRTWANLSTTAMPNSFGDDAWMVYDPTRSALIEFGSGRGMNETWDYSSGAWSNLTAGVAPGVGAAGAFDPGGGYLVAFGGTKGPVGPVTNVTWSFA
jgi:hypothetical protein